MAFDLVAPVALAIGDPAFFEGQYRRFPGFEALPPQCGSLGAATSRGFDKAATGNTVVVASPHFIVSPCADAPDDRIKGLFGYRKVVRCKSGDCLSGDARARRQSDRNQFFPCQSLAIKHHLLMDAALIEVPGNGPRQPFDAIGLDAAECGHGFDGKRIEIDLCVANARPDDDSHRLFAASQQPRQKPHFPLHLTKSLNASTASKGHRKPFSTKACNDEGGVMVTSDQIAAIHALAKRAGLDDDARRAVMMAATGKSSSRDLSAAEAGRVIEQLRMLAGEGVPADGALRIEGPYADKMRALWLSAWHLGITRDRTDRALAAFVRRQTGLDHPRWLREAAAASAVIEALRAWMTREAGVEWPTSRAGEMQQDAVIAAQARILGIVPPAGGGVAAMRALGRRVRAAKGRRALRENTP